MKCKSCGKEVHPLCPSVGLDKMTYMLNDGIEKMKDFMVEMLQVENELIENLQKKKKKEIDRYSCGSLDNWGQEIIEKIYDNKTNNALAGN